MEYKYIDVADAILKEYEERLGVNKAYAKVLHNRGMNPDILSEILKNPGLFIRKQPKINNVEEAAKSVLAVARDPKIEIWTFNDYDVDGLTSGYIATDFLSKIAVNEVQVKFPNRSEGYGLSMEFCKKLVEYKNSNEEGLLPFVITTDNGVTKVEEVDYLKSNGIDCLITDHHQPKEILPDALIVNPHIDKEGHGKHLAGCAVAYKLMREIELAIHKESSFDCKLADLNTDQYLFAVAIGTIADMMPSHPENIAFVLEGFRKIKKNEISEGFKVFFKFLGIKEPTVKSIGFEIGPRLNACGRLNDIYQAALLFFEEDPDEALEIIRGIEVLNNERKKHTKKLQEEIKKENFATENVLFFNMDQYPVGIGAIAAGKMSDQFNRPAIAYAKVDNDTAKGSIRSISGVNLVPILEELKQEGLIIDYGGHEEAAGLSFLIEKLDLLMQRAEALFEEELKKLEDLGEKVIYIDDYLDFSFLTKKYYEELNTIPLLFNVDDPIFYFKDLTVIGINFSSNNQENIQFTLEDPKGNIKKIWAWRFASSYKDLGSPKKIDIIGEITPDFMNKKKMTIQVIDILKSETPKEEIKKNLIMKKNKKRRLVI